MEGKIGKAMDWFTEKLKGKKPFDSHPLDEGENLERTAQSVFEDLPGIPAKEIQMTNNIIDQIRGPLR